MRLVRFVQFAIGVAAASGGAVVVLSGSALAADSGSLGTVTQSDTVQTTTVHQKEVSTQPATVDVHQQDTAAATEDSTGDDTNTVTSGQPDAEAVSPASDTDSKSQVSQTQTTTSTANGSSAPTVPSTVSTALSAAPVESPVPVASSAAEPSTTTTAAPVSQAVSDSSASNVIPEVTVKTPMEPVQGRFETADASFQTTVLPIQPTITNRLPLEQDLAPTAPSAPGPARAPSPAKSNGTLGSLTAELAAIVVPQPILLHVVTAPRAALALSLVGLVALLLQIFVFSYGLWLRRGGFATAARSDAPTHEGFSSIATPFLLGYVESPPRLHSPILMVVAMVPNALKKGGYAMKSMRILGVTSATCGVALAIAGTALADTNAAITATGADSTQTVKVVNSTELSSTNLNVTTVTNTNDQVATSGNVAAVANTNVSGAGSGSASNNNSTTTQVQTAQVGGSGQGISVSAPAQGQGVGCGCSTTTSSSQQPAKGSGTGSVLGVSTVAPAMLPEVGATVPVDVSALRAAWHAPSTAPTTALVKQTRGIATGMLGVASLLSLLGGLGSALYGRRQERRV
jgi:hypothetical protein